MKNIAVVVLVLLLIGCGSKESVSAKADNTAPAGIENLAAGINYLKESNPAEAIKSFQLAIKENPRDSKAYLVLAETYIHMRSYDRAEALLSAATKVVPPNGNLYYLLAVSQGLAGDKDDAKESIQKSIFIFQQQKDLESLKKSVAFYRGLESTQ